jgi:hypothetical protein
LDAVATQTDRRLDPFVHVSSRSSERLDLNGQTRLIWVTVSEMSSRRCGTLSENVLDPAVKADRRRAGKASKRQRPKPVMTVPDGRLEDDDWVKQPTQRGPPEKASYRGRRASYRGRSQPMFPRPHFPRAHAHPPATRHRQAGKPSNSSFGLLQWISIWN